MPSRVQQNSIPLRKISDFKSRLSGGGARPNLFEVELAFPDAVAIANDVLQKSRFLVMKKPRSCGVFLFLTEFY